MVAYKVSNKDTKHVLSGAQHCECENMFVDCFKQSEVNEVRLELKSLTYSTETWPRSTCAYITYRNINNLTLLLNLSKTGLQDILQRRVRAK